MLTKDLNSLDEMARNRAKTAVKFIEDYDLPPDMRRRILPYSSEAGGADTESPSMSPVVDRPELTTAELTRRLADGVGGVAGGDGWADAMVVPSPQNPVAGWTSVPRERPVDDDIEETERRRRRREAMVLHDGAGTIGEEDIIRPR